MATAVRVGCIGATVEAIKAHLDDSSLVLDGVRVLAAVGSSGDGWLAGWLVGWLAVAADC